MNSWKDPSKVLPFYNTTVVVSDGIEEVEATWVTYRDTSFGKYSNNFQYPYWEFKDKVIEVKKWKRKDEDSTTNS